ncbi:MAG: DUF3879 family protein [Alphaproteobacteria bacterium]|nr:DUF3879 family protein [Alphaproteobacteria bacterium]
MSKITDYGFLFQQMFGTKNNVGVVNPLKVSDLSNGSLRSQLNAVGIDTNSAQYKAAVKEMTNHAGNSGMFTNVQAIKNLMRQYDKDGDYIDPTTGLAGLLVTEENAESRKKLISIPESSLDDMFELTKREFLQGNGMGNGDTTKRSDVYTDLHRKMGKNNRLAAGYTLSQYEKAYTQAFIEAAKAADPTWKAGKPIKAGALDGITRENVESNLSKVGNRLVKAAVDIRC